MDGSRAGLANAHGPPRTSNAHAPWIHVVSQSIVSVEHPYIVRNIDKGIDSLGGQIKLDNVRLHTNVDNGLKLMDQ